MQVNSAQDWLTARKRQIAAATYHAIPPPQSLRTASLFTSVLANRATQIRRRVTASECCLSNGSTAAPGTDDDLGEGVSSGSL
jgi:hypothetical protein